MATQRSYIEESSQWINAVDVCLTDMQDEIYDDRRHIESAMWEAFKMGYLRHKQEVDDAYDNNLHSLRNACWNDQDAHRLAALIEYLEQEPEFKP